MNSPGEDWDWTIVCTQFCSDDETPYQICKADDSTYCLQMGGHVPYLFLYPPIDVFKEQDPEWTMESVLNKFADSFQELGAFTVFFPSESSIYKDPFKAPMLAPVDIATGTRRPLVRSTDARKAPEDPTDQVLCDPYDAKHAEYSGRYDLQIIRDAEDPTTPFLIIAENERGGVRRGGDFSHRPMAPPDDMTLDREKRILERIRIEANRTMKMAKRFHAIEARWRIDRAEKLNSNKGDCLATMEAYTHDLPGSFHHIGDSWDKKPAWSTRRAAESLTGIGSLAWTPGEGSSYIYQSRDGNSVFGLHNEDVGTASVNISRGFASKKIPDSEEWDQKLFDNQPFKAWSLYGTELREDGYPELKWHLADRFRESVKWLKKNERECGQRHRHATIYTLEENSPHRLLNIQPAGSTTFTLLGALHQGINVGSTINEAIAIAPHRYKLIIRPIVKGETNKFADEYIAKTTCSCDAIGGIHKGILSGDAGTWKERYNTIRDHKVRWREYRHGQMMPVAGHQSTKTAARKRAKQEVAQSTRPVKKTKTAHKIKQEDGSHNIDPLLRAACIQKDDSPTSESSAESEAAASFLLSLWTSPLLESATDEAVIFTPETTPAETPPTRKATFDLLSEI